MRVAVAAFRSGPPSLRPSPTVPRATPTCFDERLSAFSNLVYCHTRTRPNTRKHGGAGSTIGPAPPPVPSPQSPCRLAGRPAPPSAAPARPIPARIRCGTSPARPGPCPDEDRVPPFQAPPARRVGGSEGWEGGLLPASAPASEWRERPARGSSSLRADLIRAKTVHIRRGGKAGGCVRRTGAGRWSRGDEDRDGEKGRCRDVRHRSGCDGLRRGRKCGPEEMDSKGERAS
jgi:hypothetical protein